MARYALIADDLTGALDAGAGFARAGLRASLPFSSLPADAPDADVVLVDTWTRDVLSAAWAGDVAHLAAEQLKRAGIERVYKKIDSVLRGQPGAELAAVLDVFGGRALVAPAFPAQGRITRQGVQYAHGRPVEPYGGHLAAALGAAAGRSDVHDAATDDDLARIARAAAADPAYRVWCGTAGLAAHVPAALGLRPGGGGPPSLPPADRLLVIAGSAHPVTQAQLEVLCAAGWAQVSVTAPPAVDYGPWSLALSLPDRPGLGLIMTGGHTARRVCDGLHATAIHVVGEALPGIPIGVLELPDGQVPIAAKSGGFGPPDALLTTADVLLGGRAIRR